jgi:carbamoyltransferase
VAFLKVRKKFWLAPIILIMAAFGGLSGCGAGFGGRTVHLHPLLMAGGMKVLGISAFYHDSAAALVVDGRDQGGSAGRALHPQEARPGLSPPRHRVLPGRGRRVARGRSIIVVFYDKPFIKFERLLETYLSFAPRGFRSFRMALPIWLKEKLFQKIHAPGRAPGAARRRRLGRQTPVHRAPPEPRRERLLPLAVRRGRDPHHGRRRRMVDDDARARPRQRASRSSKEQHFPHSLGLLYSAFTYYTGFKVNSGEYKIMGLAPYGEPRYAQTILDNLMDLKPDGTFRLNMDYFDYCTGLRMTNGKFDELFGGPPRQPEQLLTQREMDLTASVQKVTEEVVLRLGRSIAKQTGQRNLCLAGGVALNCVANGKLLRDGSFDSIWIQPAAGDAGGALGAALAGYHQLEGRPRPAINGHLDRMQGAYLGPAFSTDASAKLACQPAPSSTCSTTTR